MEEKLFNVEFTVEAKNELKGMDIQNQKRVARTVRNFEILGKEAVNSRPLDLKGRTV